MIDGVAIWLIAAFSLAIVPLSAHGAASYPRRLKRHRAEQANADAAARVAAAQRDQEHFSRFGVSRETGEETRLGSVNSGVHDDKRARDVSRVAGADNGSRQPRP